MPGNLNQRTIARGCEFRGRIGLAEVAHRAVVGDPGAAVRPEPHVGRTIERVDATTYKGLLEGLVKYEARDLELKRLTNFGKVKQLDLMTDFRIPIRPRETEIALQCIERSATLHRPLGKEIGTKSMPVNEGRPPRLPAVT